MSGRFWVFEEGGKWFVADRHEPHPQTARLREPGIVCKTGDRVKAFMIAAALGSVSAKEKDSG